MAAPVTRQCSCTNDHLCPTGARLRRRAQDRAPSYLVLDEAEETKEERDAWRKYRRALRVYRRHVGGGR